MNQRHLKEEPALIHQSAEKEGWIFRLKLENPEELHQLIDSQSYQAASKKLKYFVRAGKLRHQNVVNLL